MERSHDPAVVDEKREDMLLLLADDNTRSYGEGKDTTRSSGDTRTHS